MYMKELLTDYDFDKEGITAATLDVRYYPEKGLIELAFFDKNFHYVDGVFIEINQTEEST